jgi:hypothetical protein
MMTILVFTTIDLIYRLFTYSNVQIFTDLGTLTNSRTAVSSKMSKRTTEVMKKRHDNTPRRRSTLIYKYPK